LNDTKKQAKMSDHNKNGKDEPVDDKKTTENSDIKTDETDNSDENAVKNETGTKGDDWEKKAAELNDKYLRLYSEFDNFRKRSIKEKSDIIRTAGEEIFKVLLPVIDDMDRASKANENVEDAKAIKEGFQLIHHKLKNAVQQKGLSSFDSIGTNFDSDLMEAITHIPATSDDQKGKVVDEVEKGYKLGDKVIRFAKVVVAQ
jgi:molecular chaperone GrpE